MTKAQLEQRIKELENEVSLLKQQLAVATQSQRSFRVIELKLDDHVILPMSPDTMFQPMGDGVVIHGPGPITYQKRS